MKLKINKLNPSLGGLIAVEYVKFYKKTSVDIEWSETTSINNLTELSMGTNDILRSIARNFAENELYGNNLFEKGNVDHWLLFSIKPTNTMEEFLSALDFLNKSLASVTYLANKRFTIADFAVFEFLYTNKFWNEEAGPSHVLRWYTYLKHQEFIKIVLDCPPHGITFKNQESPVVAVGNRAQEGKFIDLPEAELGKVIVRFPPEASGYLHIGHAKAALLNQYYQQKFSGKLIMRFDDTNPAKENVDFEKVILEDVEMLDIKPDLFTHTSQYFDLMLEYCEQLLKQNMAYVDDTDAETMKIQREQKIESVRRNNSYEENLKMWNEMKNGTELGQKCCVRAKIDMKSLNGCLRDPTIYRCKDEPHPRTGTKYKVYPTYDFACPIVDSVEGVTHTLRTMEYHDRDPQYYWFIDALKIRKPYIWEYSRLSMTHTVLSKRKLTWFVENKFVDGWDDPRMPTVRGVLRRGMTVNALKEFIIAQGSSRSVVFMEWDKIWAFNKKIIDPIVPRFTAIDYNEPVTVFVENINEKQLENIQKHPKNPNLGLKEVWIATQILIDRIDAELLKEGENATFINWGNLLIKKIFRDDLGITYIEAKENLDNKDFKKTLKLTWLADTPKALFTPVWCVYFDHLISKPLLGKDEDFKNFINKNTRFEKQMLGDPELKKLKKGDIIQLQRIGNFIVDVAYEPPSKFSFKEQAVILFHIPDGHKDNPIQKFLLNRETVNVESNTIINIEDLNNQIKNQGDKIRKLKAQNIDKTIIDQDIKILLDLKSKYKSKTGKDWSPTIDQEEIKNKEDSNKIVEDEFILNEKITAQGNKVRELKGKKADKSTIDSEVEILLKLKADYKKITGKDWKPESVSQKPATGQENPTNENSILTQITTQGNKVRDLKSKKADKSTIDSEVQILLKLKADYKKVTGKDWKPGTVPEKPAVDQENSTNENSILTQITTQGNKVRDLKSKKADKSTIDSEVQILLKLKADYKQLTGKDWKPGTVPEKPAVDQENSTNENSILTQITTQGNKVRDLKSKKADKSTIDSEVQVLLKLKADYKQLTGKDWKPGTVPEKPAVDQENSTNENSILTQITTQGNKVRDLKSKKADKSTIDSEVQILLKLKADYKKVTGKDWKPGTVPEKPAVDQENSTNENSILTQITTQGNKVRDLKSKKADKSTIDSEVQVLLKLKADYKQLTGKDWKPGTVPEKPAVGQENLPDENSILTQITTQGNKVRDLKSKKADKSTIDSEVQILLKLKADYKQLTGKDWKPPASASAPAPAPASTTANKQFEKKVSKELKNEVLKSKKDKTPPKSDHQVDETVEGQLKKQTRLGLEVKKEENLSEWYSQVITKGELIEYYDVSGCYILRPWSYAIWESIKIWFDEKIKDLGVENCYFPIFVSKYALEKEKAHIADFSPEVAWVTKSGDSDMAEPIAIRPTSETVMYPAYAKWIQSYRDLPIKLNQWNNVVRWEFKHPQPFIRTREFLWQEGHTAFATLKEAEEEVEFILNLYGKIYTDLLAIPVIKGRKTEKEKFAGGNYTLTVEAFVSASGRAIQGATSHHLGQNFSKMVDIVYEDPETQEKKFVYQNSWGITTRTIGVMVMIHADNQGLVLPPRVASIQIVLVPCGITVSLPDNLKNKLLDSCKNLYDNLKTVGIKVKGDYRFNYSPGWKFNHWELKGVPIRVELGPKDLEKNQIVAVRRDTGEKIIISRDNAIEKLKQLLDNIHENLYKRANDDLKSRIKLIKNWIEFCPNLENKNILLVPFCGDQNCETNIKNDSTRDADELETGAPSMGAKSLCIPFEQPDQIRNDDKCIHPKCTRKPINFVLFGRSY